MIHTTFVGKVEVSHTQVAAFSCAGEEPCSFAELFERDRNIVVQLDGAYLSAGLTWHNCIHVQGVREHEEALLPLPLMTSAKLAAYIDPEAPPEFRRAIDLLFAVELSEADVRARPIEIAQTREAVQSIELPDLVLPGQMLQPGPECQNQKQPESYETLDKQEGPESCHTESR